MLLFQGLYLKAQSNFNYEEVNSTPSTFTITRNVIKTDVAYRMGNGVTTFLIDFQGNLWDEDSKGAVKYACQLLEEYLPTSYPIKIKMTRDSAIPVSFVNTSVHIEKNAFLDFAIYEGQKDNFRIPTATMKRFGVFFGGALFSFFNSPDVFGPYDGEIIFSPDNIFSHTIDGNVSPDKYDLVTVTLREITKILGMFPGVKKIGSNSLQVLMDDFITPYAYNIIYVSDPESAYSYATSGELSIAYRGNGYNIYSPSKFDASKSLFYFAQDSDNEETLLLQPDLPKGTSITKIGNGLLDVLSRSGWAPPEQPIGGGDGGPGAGRHVKDTEVRTLGVISTPSESRSILVADTTVNIKRAYNTLSTINPPGNFPYQYIANDGIVYDARYDNNPGGWAFYLLKKDGTLDKVFTQADAYSSFTFDLSQLSNFEDYARTSDGYLRGRLNWNRGLLDLESGYNYAKHMYINYKPPTPVLAPKRNFVNTQPDDPGSFYKEIELAFSNVVGATNGRIIQKEYDGGRVYTSTYAVDIAKGVYTATVDKEIVSTFQLVTQNENGISYSEIITIQPTVNSYSYSMNMTTSGDILECKFIDINKLPVSVDILSGKIYNLLNPTFSVMDFSNDIVDISSLTPGIYVVNVIDEYNNSYSKKIVR